MRGWRRAIPPQKPPAAESPSQLRRDKHDVANERSEDGDRGRSDSEEEKPEGEPPMLQADRYVLMEMLDSVALSVSSSSHCLLVALLPSRKLSTTCSANCRSSSPPNMSR